LYELQRGRNQSGGSKDEACLCLTDWVAVNSIGHPRSMKLWKMFQGVNFSFLPPPVQILH
jgi:hypothetical protein